MSLYPITSLISSCLLFIIQLIVGKKILPWFGGAASVWTTLMLFFMTTLFVGYLYTNHLRSFSAKKQRLIHLLTILVSSLSILFNQLIYHSLIPPFPTWIRTVNSNPMVQILILLSISVGPAYFLLSTTSTVLQHWYSNIYPKRSPYYLYVLSNIGSFGGLASYPFLIEPNVTILHQEQLWSLAFFICAVLLVIISIKARFSSTHSKITSLSFSSIISWLSLSTISNVALLATTTYTTQSISSVPFMWIVPLSIYLISFSFAFSEKKWYSRELLGTLLMFSASLTSLLAANIITTDNQYLLFALPLTSLFLTNLICHSELFLLKPKPQHLTHFYLYISLGGVIASIICSIIAPNFFPDFWEYPLSLVMAILAFLIPYQFFSSNTLFTLQYFFISGIALFVIFTTFFHDNLNTNKSRNFYGVLSINIEGDQNSSPSASNVITKTIYNGSINHGYQVLDGTNNYEPTIYYDRKSAAGVFIDNHPKRLQKQPLRIGVIGLGTGAMAGYCQKGDYFRFYEINPSVIDLNNKHFTFLKHCQEVGGQVDIVLGDARLSLESEIAEKKNSFDFLAVDAFVDDAIPTHLLTREAIEIYLKHLSPKGVIGFHISNRYLILGLSLDPTIKDLNLYRIPYESDQSTWYLVSASPLNNPLVFTKVDSTSTIRPWTDNFTNIFQILR